MEFHAQAFHRREAFRLRKLFFGQRLGVGIGERGGVDFLVRHRIERGPIGLVDWKGARFAARQNFDEGAVLKFLSFDSTCFAHVSKPCGLK